MYRRSFLFVLVLTLSTGMTKAQNLLNPLEVDGVTARAWGFAQMNKSDSKDDVSVNLFRVFGDISSGRFHAFGEFELLDSSSRSLDRNWLNQLWLKYTVDGWSVKIGRSFGSALKVTNPPFLQETVGYENVRFGAYGTGVQVSWASGGMYHEATVSARHDMQFDGSDQFDFLEYGAYSSIPIGSTGVKSIAVAQLSQEFTRLFGGYHFDRRDFHSRGGVYRGDEVVDRNDKTTAFVFASYRVRPWLELHYRVERVWGHTNDVVATTGLRLVSSEDNLTLTTNYVGHSDQDQENALLVRFQIRF